MQIVTDVLGWVVWVFVLRSGFGTFFTQNSAGDAKITGRIGGAAMLLVCIVTVVLPISKFWVLAAFPAAQLLVLCCYALGVYGYRPRSLRKLERESEATGVPLAVLLERETERMESHK
jgi:predicted membrane protein